MSKNGSCSASQTLNQQRDREAEPQIDRSPDPGASLRASFHALSDPLRLEIVEFLRDQEACVCEMQTKLSISPSKLSFHLKTLKNAQILRSRQEGRWIYYSLNLPQIAALEQYLADFRRLSPIAPARTCKD